MMSQMPFVPATPRADHSGLLDDGTEAELCETCYQLIVNVGIENALACVGRAARVRAGDYVGASRRLYLLHQRASSRIRAAYREIVQDAAQIDQIVEEEKRRSGGVDRESVPGRFGNMETPAALSSNG